MRCARIVFVSGGDGSVNVGAGTGHVHFVGCRSFRIAKFVYERYRSDEGSGEKDEKNGGQRYRIKKSSKNLHLWL